MRQALFGLQQEGYVEVLFRSGWCVLAFNFEQFEQLYDLRMVLKTSAIDRLDEGPFQTDSGCRNFRTGRSKPVTELCNLNVSYVAMISTIATPAPDQFPTFSCGKFEP